MCWKSVQSCDVRTNNIVLVENMFDIKFWDWYLMEMMEAQI